MPAHETATHETTRHVIYRCKPCKRTERRSYDVTIQTMRGVSQVKFWSQSTATWRRGAYVSRYGPEQVTCGCGRIMLALEVKGRRVDSIPCGARCLAATGPNCDCSCAGAHHGRNYAHGVT